MSDVEHGGDDGGDGFCVRSLAVTYPDGAAERAHTHPWGQLVYGLSGVIRVATEDASWLAPAARAIWTPAGVAHALSMQGRVAMRTLYIAPALAAALPAQPAVLEVAPLLRELILHILAIGMLDPGRPAHARMAGLLIDLLADARPQDLVLPMPRDGRALALARRILDDPSNHADLSRLAQGAGASLRTLQRLFPGQTGLALEAWRQKARLIHAVALLSAGAPVTTTALDCGYDSVSAFIAAFRRQFGVTPGRYRPAL